MKDDPIYFWFSDDCAWIRLTGDGCWLNATRVKDFGKQVIRKRTRQFIVDLEKCSGLDSTFLGILTWVALKMREWDGTLRVVNVPHEQQSQLRDLGLDKLLLG